MTETNLEAMSLQDLLTLYAGIQKELQRRGVSRTAGSIQGELGEQLALLVYGGVMPLPGAKAYDLTDNAGRRIQVKTRTLPPGDDRTFHFNNLDFDFAICIRFDRESGELDWAREYSTPELRELVSPHAGGFRLPMGRAKQNGVDVTASFRGAHTALTAFPTDLEGQ